MNKRPYLQTYDGSGDLPISNQVDNPANLETIPSGSASRRLIVGSDGLSYPVADQTVSQRGAKSIIWSSEGFTTNGISVPALTTNQKKATGSQNTNQALATCVSPSAQALPSGVSMPTILDLSPYRNITLMVALSAITGTSIQFEFDLQDDSGTPLVLPLWKPAALTAAPAYYLISIGPGVAFPQANTTPSTAPTGFSAISVPTNWTYAFYPMDVTPNGQFQWTASSLTAVTWTAWIYGSN